MPPHIPFTAFIVPASAFIILAAIVKGIDAALLYLLACFDLVLPAPGAVPIARRRDRRLPRVHLRLAPLLPLGALDLVLVVAGLAPAALAALLRVLPRLDLVLPVPGVVVLFPTIAAVLLAVVGLALGGGTVFFFLSARFELGLSVSGVALVSGVAVLLVVAGLALGDPNSSRSKPMRGEAPRFVTFGPTQCATSRSSPSCFNLILSAPGALLVSTIAAVLLVVVGFALGGGTVFLSRFNLVLSVSGVALVGGVAVLLVVVGLALGDRVLLRVPLPLATTSSCRAFIILAPLLPRGALDLVLSVPGDALIFAIVAVPSGSRSARSLCYFVFLLPTSFHYFFAVPSTAPSKSHAPGPQCRGGVFERPAPVPRRLA